MQGEAGTTRGLMIQKTHTEHKGQGASPMGLSSPGQVLSGSLKVTTRPCRDPQDARGLPSANAPALPSAPCPVPAGEAPPQRRQALHPFVLLGCGGAPFPSIPTPPRCCSVSMFSLLCIYLHFTLFQK